MTMTTEKIFVGDENGNPIELTGQALKDFLADRAQIQAESAARQAEQDAKAAAKESALTKLQALGLSEAEAKQIVGI
jgi:Holliday junction resolvasome RuvABC DNA-binding subunit